MNKPFNSQDILIGLVAALIGVLSFIHIVGAGVFGEEFKGWLEKEAPVITLFFLAVTASYIILERKKALSKILKRQDELTENVNTCMSLIHSTNNDAIDVTAFEHDNAMMDYIINQMDAAQNKVEDVSLKPADQIFHTNGAYQGYARYKEIKAKLIDKPGFVYREVVHFSTEERYNHIKSLLKKQKANYHVVYYDKLGGNYPYLSFIIIDDNQVILVDHLFPKTRPSEVRLAIRNAHAVNLFQEYYDVIFEGGTKINSLKDFDSQPLKQIGASWTS